MIPRPLTVALCILLGVARPAAAPGQGPVHTPRVHALTGARIVIAPGRVLERGTVILRDGLIEAVGPTVPVPADARVWTLDSLTVYAGLIDLAMPVAPPKPEAKDKDAKKGDAKGGLGHALSMVTPETMIADRLALSESDRTARRNQGILAARILPDQGIFRGQAALVNLGDGDLPANLLRRACGQVMTFATASGNLYPESLMGSVAVMRQTLEDSRWHRAAHARYDAHPAGLARPEWNLALAALEPVALAEESAIFVTNNMLDLLRAGEMAREFGLRLEFVGSGEEYKRLAEVTAITKSLVLPVRFPAAPAVDEPAEALAVTLEQLRAWDEAPRNPLRVHEAGIVFALTAQGLTDISAFRANVGKAMAEGLPADVALAAVTTVPAGMVGLADRLGTVEAGKIANLVVTDGDLFDEKTKVREVWIDGRRYEIEDVKPPEGDPRGTWELQAVDAAGTTYPATLIVGGDMGALTATLQVMGQTIAATASQSGRTVVVTFPGEGIGATGPVRMSLEATGDAVRGSGNGSFGEFSVQGTRTGKSEPAKPGSIQP